VKIFRDVIEAAPETGTGMEMKVERAPEAAVVENLKRTKRRIPGSATGADSDPVNRQ
jgi:hypothetical protein